MTLRLIASAMAQDLAATTSDHHLWLMGHVHDDWLGNLRNDPRVERLAAPYGRAMLGAVGAACRRSQLGTIDGVQCWSLGAVALAHTLMPRTEKVWVLTVPPRGRTLDTFKKMLRRMPGLAVTLRVVSLSRAWQDVLASLPGVRVEWMQPDPTTDVRLPEASKSKRSDRPCVVAMLCDDLTDPRCDARMGIMALGIACRVLQARRGAGAARIEHELWVHPEQAFRREAQTLLEKFGGTWRLVQESRVTRPWMLGGEVDVAMLPCGMGVAGWYAAQAGLPIAVAADADVDERSIWDQAVLRVEGGQRNWAAVLCRLLSEREVADEGATLYEHLIAATRQVLDQQIEQAASKRPWRALWQASDKAPSNTAHQGS